MPAPSVESMPLMQLMRMTHFGIANTYTIAPNLKEAIKWALHVALRELVERSGHHAFRMSAEIDISAADVTAARKTWPLPHDFSQEIEEGVKFKTSDFRTLKYISAQEYDARMLDADTTGAEPWLYLIRGRNKLTGHAEITLWPTPTVARTIVISYIAFPDPIWSADDGAFLDRRVPPEYHQTLPTGALRHLPRFISDADWQKHHLLWLDCLKDAKNKAVQVQGQTYQREMYESGAGVLGLGRAPDTFTGAAL